VLHDFFWYSGPDDVILSGEDTPFLVVKGLHIDKAVGSPTKYTFQVHVWDYHNLTDAANVTVTYKKGERCVCVSTYQSEEVHV